MWEETTTLQIHKKQEEKKKKDINRKHTLLSYTTENPGVTKTRLRFLPSTERTKQTLFEEIA